MILEIKKILILSHQKFYNVRLYQQKKYLLGGQLFARSENGKS